MPKASRDLEDGLAALDALDEDAPVLALRHALLAWAQTDRQTDRQTPSSSALRHHPELLSQQVNPSIMMGGNSFGWTASIWRGTRLRDIQNVTESIILGTEADLRPRARASCLPPCASLSRSLRESGSNNAVRVEMHTSKYGRFFAGECWMNPTSNMTDKENRQHGGRPAPVMALKVMMRASFSAKLAGCELSPITVTCPHKNRPTAHVRRTT
eukprot:2563811-Rhodomonas_salina.1